MPFELDTAAFTLARDWIPDLLRALRQQRSAREDEVDRIADLFGDPLQLAEFYVEPYCQQFNPADDDEDEARYIVRELIFSRLQYFFGGHSLTGGHQMFILADSGMGKSSVLMMLKLAHLKSFWPQNYDCVLLKLGNDSLEQIESVAKKRRTILLLDALDEDPRAWGRITHRLQEILLATRNFWRVIISCRTQFFSAGEDPFNRRGKVQVGGFLCPVVYLSLFSDDQIGDYLKRRFPKNPRRISEAKILLSRMQSLRFRPMLLAHIEDLLHSDTQEWTEYTIYHALVSAWLLREHAKPLTGRRMPDTQDLWKVCTVLALQLHSTGHREILHDKLESLMGGNFRHLSKLDIGGRSLLNKNSQGWYRFSHYSIQEFLVARELIYGTESRPLGSIRSTDQLIRFLVSWLSSQDVSARSKLRLAVLNLKRANLSGMDLTGANLCEGLLGGAQLGASDMTQAHLRLANLTGAQIGKAKLVKADLTKAKLMDSNLVEANLREAILFDTELNNANLERADLNDAYLSGATLRGARLMGSNLENAHLKGAKLLDAICDDSTIWPKEFDYEAAGVKKKKEEKRLR